MTRRFLLLLILGVSLLHGCRRTASVSRSESQGDGVRIQRLATPQSGGTKLFRIRTAAETGIDLVHQFPLNASVDMLSDQTSGMGVCIGDVDDDGLPDVYVTNYDQGNRLYRNLGSFQFKDITQQAGVAGEGRWCAGPSFVDIDNDGDLDLHVCVYGGKNLLYINDGKEAFTEQAARYGLAISAASVMMSFADYDLDGDLDGYLVTNRLMTDDRKHVLPKNSRAVLRSGIVQRKQRSIQIAPEYKDLFAILPKGERGRFELIIAGQEDVLLRNENGRFRSVNREAGITGHGVGLAATWWDFNGDHRPDLYVSNDYKGADQLYRNNGDGTFTDVVEELCPHVPWYSMGADVGDVNNDGRIDLFASDMSGTSHYRQKVSMGDMSDDAWFLDLARPLQYMRNVLFVNAGEGRLLEAASMAGLSSTDWTWSPKFADFDNDGLLDLFVSNGMSRDYMDSDLTHLGDRGDARWKSQPILRERNLAFRNLGNIQFEEVGETWGLDELSASYGASVGDLDRDGDLDLVVTNFDGPVSVYENQSRTGNRLLLKLVGTSSNRQGIGAAVSVRTSLGQQTRYLNSAQGFMSANEQLVHIGLGEALSANVEIRWPSGVTQRLDSAPLNRFVTVTEPKGVPRSELPTAQKTQLFQRTSDFSRFIHREQPFDDYAIQPLLPGKKSQRGPGIACADVNADGIDDFYLGGAAGMAGLLVLGGVNKEVTSESLAADLKCEDMGALFFDADADGDLDLYVVSGGVEAQLGDPVLQDRLYLQEQGGRFVKSQEALPSIRESGSCVCAADYDADGDLDLFVGGYVVPGAYPKSSPSHLLRNDGGKFVDVTVEDASQLSEARLVSGALWSDANGDGAIDLLVAQEWGTVDLYLNARGKLKRFESGLAAYTGWWNGIVGGDIDADGDIDYVVTNNGLNTKYHADAQHPVRLFSGDFDGSGRPRLVEAKYEEGVLLPERGKSCSTAAIPMLSDRFPTYKAFAMAELMEVYGSEALGKATSLSATTLESGVLINDGSAHFEFRALPRLAQISPSHGAALTHLNGDQYLDLVLAQNDFSPQRETGRMDGGVSLVLLGDGKGRFNATWPHESGVSISGDAKSVLVTDLDQDGAPDLLFGINNQPWRSYRSVSQRRPISVRLHGASGNPTGIGARVEVTFSSGQELTQEVYAGTGYLTQSGSVLYFGQGGATAKEFNVRWPNGEESRLSAASNQVVIEHPTRGRQ